MKVLVIGGGCREHAIIKALQEDSKVTKVYSLPSRESISNLETLKESSILNHESLSHSILKENIELVVIGPEQPLVDGLSDHLRSKGIKVFGPSSQAARLEASKVFSKTFMKEFSIPTASYQVVHSVESVLKESHNFTPPYVLKADGLAAGKGVFICQNKQELEQKAKFIFEERALGAAGDQALLEDFQFGEEMSIFVITGGEDYSLLPVAKDYKRLLDGQKGPNTGGMGAIAPIQISKDLLQQIETIIIRPTLRGLKERGTPYCGVLYIGVMMSKGLPKVLEYNVRFGDPEAQVLLPLLEGSWLDVFYQASCGKTSTLKWKKQYATCVVLASQGYPEKVLKGSTIEGSIHHQTSQAYFLHGSLKNENQKWLTNGGRVLNSVAIAESQKQSIDLAYQQSLQISWEGMQFRKDIGQ